MRRLLLSLLLAACAAATRAEDKIAPLRARLAAAAAESSLDTPDLAPWHLKLEAQLFDDKGTPTEKGTVETWWIDPNEFQTVYTFPSYTATEVLSPTGLRRTRAAGLPPDIVRVLLQRIIHPMPDQAYLDRSTPELRKQTFSKIPLECIMLDQTLAGQSFQPIGTPLGLFPTFCFSPAQNTIQVSFDIGAGIILPTLIGTFQNRTIATAVTIQRNGITSAIGQVTALGSRTNLKPPPVDEANLEALSPMPVVDHYMKRKLHQGADPIYPQGAKDHHASGTVLIHGIIGRDGRVRDMKLVQVPDPDLAIAAIAAVSSWVYEPYVANGKTTEIATTISVNFTLSSNGFH